MNFFSKKIIKTFDLSGMGRGYEDGIQQMVWTALKLIDGMKKDILKDTIEYKNIYGICKTPESFEPIKTAMLFKVNGCTGAGYQCAVNHIRVIHEKGYDYWCRELEILNREPCVFDLERMELLPFIEDDKKWN